MEGSMTIKEGGDGAGSRPHYSSCLPQVTDSRYPAVANGVAVAIPLSHSPSERWIKKEERREKKEDHIDEQSCDL
jgi:hypothetical protein